MDTNQSYSFLFKPLVNIERSEIFTCFYDAFSDYSMPLPTDDYQLQGMLTRKLFNQEYSYGAFYHEKLVGICLTGTFRNNAYCISIAITPGFRNKKIGKKLLQEQLNYLSDKGFKQYSLEVLANNSNGLKLYESLDFKINRKLTSYRNEDPKEQYRSLAEEQFHAIIFDELRTEFVESLNVTLLPSWQNSDIAINSTKDSSLKTICLYNYDNQLVAVSYLSTASGEIHQVYLLKESVEVLTLILLELKKHSLVPSLKWINVDSSSSFFNKSLLELSFIEVVQQFELIKRI